MSVSRTSLSLAAAWCLGAVVTASSASAQGAAAGPLPPDAATLAAQVDSVVRVDVLAQGMPSVSVAVTRTPPARLGGPKRYLVHRSGTTVAQGGNESVTLTFLLDADGDATAFVARSGGTERTMRKVQ